MPREDGAVSLLLKYNSLAQAAVEYFRECIENSMTKKQVLLQVQSVCATYACQGVKRNGGLTDTKKKQQAATNAYKTMVVPGFLAWLKEQEPPVQLPRWLNEDMMGCSNVTGEGKGEPKFYLDTNKVWSKHMSDYLVIRRDVIPAYERVTANQPSGQPPSGQQYNDQLSELLDELWIIQCKALGKTKDAIDVEAERSFFAPRSSSASPATVEEEGKERTSPSGAGSEGEGAAVNPGDKSPTELEVTTGGAAGEASGGAAEALGDGHAGAGSGGDLGPEPPADTPEYRRWIARRAAINTAKSDEASSSGGSSTSPSDSTAYPERPGNWMHPLTLTFCFFGRPAGEDEDTELGTCKESSGPPTRGARKKSKSKGSKTSSDRGSSGGGGSGEDSSPDNPLNRGAVMQFVGAGEAQSRAKVKKATAEVQQRESRDATRKQFLQEAQEQTKYSQKMLAAVERVAENTSAQRALDEEEACRKRKKQTIEDLEGDLQYCEDYEKQGIKAEIRAMRKKPVHEFTAEFVAGSTHNSLSGPSASEATSSIPALPGFSHNNGTPGSAGGGAQAQQSEVAAGPVGGATAVAQS